MKYELLNAELQDRMQTVPWFEHCGNKITTSQMVPFKSLSQWRKAVLAVLSSEWETAVHQGENALSEYLLEHHPAIYANRRNAIIEATDACIRKHLKPAIDAGTRRFAPIGTSIGAGVAFEIQRAVRGAFLEAGFADLDHGKTFFTDAFRFYEQGHFPCGWTGEWPEGLLLVF